MIQNALKAAQYPYAYRWLEQAVQATGAGKIVWNLCATSQQVHLIFQENKRLPDGIARTVFTVGGKNHQEILDSSIDWITQTTRSQEIRLLIEVDPTKPEAQTLGQALETLVHEFALHAANYGHFIKALLDVELTLSQVNDFYRMLTGPTGLLTKDAGHFLLAANTSECYNVLADYLQAFLPGKDRQVFIDEIQEDRRREGKQFSNIDIFKPVYEKVTTVNYPAKGPKAISVISMIDEVTESDIVGGFWEIVQSNLYLQHLVNAGRVQVYVRGMQETLAPDSPQRMWPEERIKAYLLLQEKKTFQEQIRMQITDLIRRDQMLLKMQYKIITVEGVEEPLTEQSILYATAESLQQILSTMQQITKLRPSDGQDCIVS